MAKQEQIITVRAAAGSSSSTASMQIVGDGKIIGVAAHQVKGGVVTGVRASISNTQGDDICKMQSIEAFKQRQGGSYKDSMKPLDEPAGLTYTINIKSESNFAADYEVDFIFLLEPKVCNQ